MNSIHRLTPTALAIAVVAALGAAGASAAELEEITVTARKTEERLQDVPISVSAFRAEDLAERNVRDVSDLSRFTPGFTLEKVNRYGVQGGVSRPVIRGMSNILGEGNASVFVDGILYSDSILAFPMQIVDRVEIIKGPQAALFGRATFSGAINLITKKGANERETIVDARLAQYDDREVNVITRGAFVTDRLFYMAHVRYFRFGGEYRNTLDGRRIGDESSRNADFSLEWRPTESFRGTFAGGYSNDDDGHAVQTLQSRFLNNCYFNAPRQYYCGTVGEQRSATLDIAGLKGTDGLHRNATRFSLALQYDLPALSIVSNSGVFDTRSEYGYDSTYQGATAIGPLTVPGATGYTRPLGDPVRNGSVLRNEVSDRIEWSTELRIQAPSAARVRWLLGAFYYSNRRDLAEYHFAATAPTVYSGRTKVANRAVFGALGYSLTDRWEVTAEARYARDAIANVNPFITPPRPEIGQTFSSTRPRVTTTYRLTPDSMVYANFARGNKPGVINADPRFPPELRFANEEKSTNYEVGTKNTLLGGRLTANVALYYIDWKNQQLTSVYQIPPALGGGTMSYITNAGKSRIRGAELELQAAVTESLTAGLTYSYTDATFVQLNDAEAAQLFGNASVKGKQLPGVPQQQVAVYGRLGFPLGSANGYVRADATYADRKFDQIYDLAWTGYATVVDLAAGITRGGWEASVWVKNLTDDRTPTTLVRYVDQLNVNVARRPGGGFTTVTQRGFLFPLPDKRQAGVNVRYRF